MPKKLGTNPKAAEARERKQQQKAETTEKVKKLAEDKLWEDDDKILQKKQSRKEEADKKKAEALRKKEEKKLLLEQESANLKSAKVATQKVTQAQIKAELERKTVVQEKTIPSRKKSETDTDYGIPVNENRSDIETISASGIDDAIAALSVTTGGEDVDRHPEKRMKAAFKAFETANLPRIKQENPSLRMSQWHQIFYIKNGQNLIKTQLISRTRN